MASLVCQELSLRIPIVFKVEHLDDFVKVLAVPPLPVPLLSLAAEVPAAVLVHEQILADPLQLCLV